MVAPAASSLGTVALAPLTVECGSDAAFRYRIEDPGSASSYLCMLVIRTAGGEPYTGLFRLGSQPANADLVHVHQCELSPGTYKWWIRLSDLELDYGCESNSLTVTPPADA